MEGGGGGGGGLAGPILSGYAAQTQVLISNKQIFCIYENKDADHVAVTAQLVITFVFI